MKIKSLFGILIVALFITSCEKNVVLPLDNYSCDAPFQDTSNIHPNASKYQSILETYRKNGLVGAVLLVKDKHGLWVGADGKADIASGIDVKPCNQFLIASISKVFTSAAVYRYIDKGVLSLEDPINKWIEESITNKVENANEAQIKHLLAHTSGIVDYYTLQMVLDNANNTFNDWTKEEILTFVYGKKATNAVGEAYYYSNTNFLLLSMILERASGLSFEEVYQQEVFDPLGLSSAYYSETQFIPDGCVKGYFDLYGNGQFVESDFFYEDELGIGGDGGIAINAYDIAHFFEQLMTSNLLTSTSLAEMTNWFDLPEAYHWEPYGQTENGFGIEKFNTQYGYAVGHSGGIAGFSSLALYFPEDEMTYVFLTNSIGNEAGNDSEEAIFLETLDVMFE